MWECFKAAVREGKKFLSFIPVSFFVSRFSHSISMKKKLVFFCTFELSPVPVELSSHLHFFTAFHSTASTRVHDKNKLIEI